MRETLMFFLLSICINSNTYTQTEKYYISFKPEIDVTYTLKYEITQDFEFNNIGIINKNGRILEVLDEDEMNFEYQLNQSFFLDIKLLFKELDTMFFQYTFRNFEISLIDQDSELTNKDLMQTINELSTFFEKNQQIVLELKSFPTKEEFKFETVSVVINDNTFTSQEEIDEIKKELNKIESFDDIVNNFLIQYPKESVAINDSWYGIENFEFEMDLNIEVKTKYTLKEKTENLYIIESSSSQDDTFEVLSDGLSADLQMSIGVSSIYHIDKESGSILKMTSKSASNGMTDIWFKDLNEKDDSDIIFGVRMKIKENSSLHIVGTMN